MRKSGAAGENWLLKGKPSLFSPLEKKKKSTNASLLPLPLPAALIACRGWGGVGAFQQLLASILETASFFPVPAPFMKETMRTYSECLVHHLGPQAL